MSSFQGEQGPSPPRRVPLGRLLIARGLLTEEQLIEGLLEQDRTGDRLGQVLIRLGFVDEPSVAMALATQHGGPLKTEYGFATGFDPGGATEPEIEAPQNPDPGVAVNGSSDRAGLVVSREDTADEIAPTPVETAPIHSQRDAVFGDPQTFPAEVDQAPSQVDAMVAQADHLKSRNSRQRIRPEAARYQPLRVRERFCDVLPHRQVLVEATHQRHRSRIAHRPQRGHDRLRAREQESSRQILNAFLADRRTY